MVIKNKIKDYIKKIKLNDKKFFQKLIKEQSNQIQLEKYGNGTIYERIKKNKEYNFYIEYGKELYEEMMLEKIIFNNINFFI